MLPITNHRTIHVPHSLATLAAIVALITALGWNSVDGGRPTADASGPAAGEAHTTVRGTATDDAESGGRASQDRPDGNGSGLSGLLPLVLPSVTAP